MLHARPALAALATAVAVAIGITAGVLTTHRSNTATGGAVVTTQLPATTAPPPTTSPPAGPRTGGAVLTTQLPATTTPPPTTSPPTGPATGGPSQPTPQPPSTSARISDPALAARQVFQAWLAGDRQRALQAATPSAVRTLFAFPPTPQLRFTECRFLRLGYDCFYSSPDVELYYVHMRVQGGASAGYRVVSITPLLRFGSPEAAARYAVSAWLAGDRAKARHAASKAVVDALWNHLADRALGPRYTGCTFRGINRGSDCNFDDTTVGLGFTMQVKGGASLGWHVVAVRFAQL